MRIYIWVYMYMCIHIYIMIYNIYVHTHIFNRCIYIHNWMFCHAEVAVTEGEGEGCSFAHYVGWKLIFFTWSSPAMLFDRVNPIHDTMRARYWQYSGEGWSFAHYMGWKLTSFDMVQSSYVILSCKSYPWYHESQILTVFRWRVEFCTLHWMKIDIFDMVQSSYVIWSCKSYPWYHESQILTVFSDV